MLSTSVTIEVPVLEATNAGTMKRKKRDGTPYERPPEIEDWLKKFEAVEGAERIRQFATLFKKSVGHVPSEVLVYFLWRAWADAVADTLNQATS